MELHQFGLNSQRVASEGKFFSVQASAILGRTDLGREAAFLAVTLAVTFALVLAARLALRLAAGAARTG